MRENGRQRARGMMERVMAQPAKCMCAALAACVILSFSFPVYAAPAFILREYDKYFASSTCEICHQKIVGQHAQSQHEKSFENPVFQGQYFRELLADAKRDPELYREAATCTACHSPIDYVVLGGRVYSEPVEPGKSGVTCDFCHTIAGYEGQAPGNGNYISRPGEQKMGPFKHKYDWHHVYSELQTKSEFCAICHEATNLHGLNVKSTYTEWKNSRYAAEGVQCQDCHMNLRGFLAAGKSVYDSGRAADSSNTFGRGAPSRSVLYTHRFPGAHSRSQMVESGAIKLAIAVESENQAVSPGDDIIIRIFVDNSLTGHKMPSGSADLRQLWLELLADTGAGTVIIPASSTGSGTYDVSGKGPFDNEILGSDIPAGDRIYRAIFVDKTDRQTLSFYDAVDIVFDNRLNASETREETYYFRIPKDAVGRVTLAATLRYLPYPSSFSRRFGLPDPEPFEIGAARTEIDLR